MRRIAIPHLSFPASPSSRPVDSAKPLAALLLAGALAAFLVVAALLIEGWVDGHLLAGWVALWTITFAGLAILAPHLRRWTATLAHILSVRLHAVFARDNESDMRDHARQDPRQLSDFRFAAQRDSNE